MYFLFIEGITMRYLFSLERPLTIEVKKTQERKVRN